MVSKCFVLTANGNYENGRFEIVGIYSTQELAEKAANELSRNYITHIEKWDIDAKAKYPRCF